VRLLALLLIAVPGIPSFAQSTPSEVEFFEKKIRPLLSDHCFECHSAQAKKLKGGLRLDTREGLLKGGPGGPAVVPGKPEQSLLLRAIRWIDDDLKMPPRKKLADEVLRDVAIWIQKGAAIPEMKDASARGASGPHWAFRRPVESPVPAGAENPVDAFVLAKLREKGLALSPEADKRTLLRRASYDLIGLPPTPEEQDAFLKDESPDAWARVLDRLLASPRYGERWCRHWLDVARYADTTDGSVDGREDPRLVNSAAYRDWVVRALNEDLPYDCFLLRQLAADLLPAENGRRELEAMGLLTLGRRFDNNVHDIIDERLDVVGRGLLGLTLSCARCHDHKFDPIPTEDYYSLYGVFAASKEKVVDRPGSTSDAYRQELARRNQELATFIRERGLEVQTHVRREIRGYLLAQVDAAPPSSNPLLTAHVKQYLSRSKTHPVWSLWHALRAVPEKELAARTPELIEKLASGLAASVAAEFSWPAPRSMREVAERFGRLLEEAEADEEKRADLEELRAVLHGPRAVPVLAQAPQSVSHDFFSNGSGYEITYLKAKIARWEIAGPGGPSRAFILEEATPKENPKVFKRGNPSSPGSEVPRRFLAALSPEERRPFVEGGGRLELARAIASPENPLTARVWVNRVWMHHFGQGLVTTPSDFGRRSDPPSHPELLDWLAARFMAGGWSTKKLHRMILLSSTYRQASDDRPEARKVDSDNRLLWKMNARRLDFEAMRDSLLAVSGRLDLGSGGPAEVLTSQPYCRKRSVYGFVDRLNLSGLLMSFDFANPTAHAPGRHFTTVPQQALFMMNSPFMREQGRGLAGRLGGDAAGATEERIRRLYRWVFNRAPTPTELAAGERFLRQAAAEPSAVALSAWSYGYGEFDLSSGRTKDFHPLGCFTGDSWQNSAYLPDVDLGWLMLDAAGGYPGEDLRHAAIRRWTAPEDGTLSIDGAVKLLYDADTYQGSIRVRVVSSRQGAAVTKIVGSGEVRVALERLEVRKGETVDFIADCLDNVAYDRFGWAPVLRMGERTWSAEADFGGPAEAPLTPWEKYAQVLLETNEFVFVD
jgi:hypothetical protein